MERIGLLIQEGINMRRSTARIASNKATFKSAIQKARSQVPPDELVPIQSAAIQATEQLRGVRPIKKSGNATEEAIRQLTQTTKSSGEFVKEARSLWSQLRGLFNR